MGLMERRLAVAAAFHVGALAVGLGGLLLGTAMSAQALVEAGGLLLLAHLLTCQWNPLGRLLQELLLRHYRCSECSLVLDLKAPWRCGCGFTSEERHCFNPCPQCGKNFAWVGCPGCGTGILI